MTSIPPELLDLGLAAFLRAAIVFLRVGGMVMFMPAFGERMVPQRVKLSLAIAFTAIVAPAAPEADWPAVSMAFFGLVLAEVAVGLILGLALRLMTIVLQLAASMIAQSTSLAQLFSGSATDPMPAIGHLLVMGGLALAVMNDLHVLAAAAMIDSYALFPVGMMPGSAELAEFGMAHVSYCFRLAFCLAAPFVLAAFIYNLALGAINKAMPQLMVILVGAPAITGAGLAMLALLSPFLLQVWLGAFQAVLTDPFGVR